MAKQVLLNISKKLVKLGLWFECKQKNHLCQQSTASFYFLNA